MASDRCLHRPPPLGGRTNQLNENTEATLGTIRSLSVSLTISPSLDSLLRCPRDNSNPRTPRKAASVAAAHFRCTPDGTVAITGQYIADESRPEAICSFAARTTRNNGVIRFTIRHWSPRRRVGVPPFCLPPLLPINCTVSRLRLDRGLPARPPPPFRQLAQGKRGPTVRARSADTHARIGGFVDNEGNRGGRESGVRQNERTAGGKSVGTPCARLARRELRFASGGWPAPVSAAAVVVVAVAVVVVSSSSTFPSSSLARSLARFPAVRVRLRAFVHRRLLCDQPTLRTPHPRYRCARSRSINAQRRFHGGGRVRRWRRGEDERRGRTRRGEGAPAEG